MFDQMRISIVVTTFCLLKFTARGLEFIHLTPINLGLVLFFEVDDIDQLRITLQI